MATATPWARPCVKLLDTWRDENPPGFRPSEPSPLQSHGGDFSQTVPCGDLPLRPQARWSLPLSCFHLPPLMPVVVLVLRSRVQVRTAHREAAVRAESGGGAVPRPFTFPNLAIQRENQISFIKREQQASTRRPPPRGVSG